MKRPLVLLAFALVTAALVAAVEWSRETQQTADRVCRQRFAAARTWDDSVEVWRDCP